MGAENLSKPGIQAEIQRGKGGQTVIKCYGSSRNCAELLRGKLHKTTDSNWNHRANNGMERRISTLFLFHPVGLIWNLSLDANQPTPPRSAKRKWQYPNATSYALIGAWRLHNATVKWRKRPQGAWLLGLSAIVLTSYKNDYVKLWLLYCKPLYMRFSLSLLKVKTWYNTVY